LMEISPDDEVVTQLLKRAKFENLRDRGNRAFAAGDYELTGNILAEAETLFPKHQWSTSLRDRLAKVTRRHQVGQPSGRGQDKPELTEATRKEAESLYRSGQEAFARGALEEAIADWERVERLAPDYLSVREYLVQAYKYLGVEHYGNNDLEQALAVWQRAAALMPDNEEIASYIKRTKAEIAKIRELSYEP
jgi:tetratricopeptide (TPR) repeat protein